MIYMLLEDTHISVQLYAMFLISRFVVEHFACRVAVASGGKTKRVLFYLNAADSLAHRAAGYREQEIPANAG